MSDEYQKGFDEGYAEGRADMEAELDDGEITLSEEAVTDALKDILDGYAEDEDPEKMVKALRKLVDDIERGRL